MGHSTRRRLSHACSAFAFLVAGSGLTDAASAQSATSRQATSKGEPLQGLDDIIVTARRIDERLQDVPVSVSVLSADALKERNVTTANDMAQVAPGLSVVGFQSRSTAVFSIRGQGEIYGVQQAGVVTYYAEVPDFSSFFYDLASVQVLKGPQGTLFGRNTTGGAVLLAPQKPGNELSGYAVVRAGNYSRFDQEFAVGGALIDDVLAVRVAGQRLRRDGYTKNLTNGLDLDDQHRESIRGTVVFTPSPAFTNTTIVQYDHIKENGTGQILREFFNSPATPFIAQLPAYLAAQRARGPRKVENEWPNYLRFKKWGVINTSALDLSDALTVKNIFRYNRGGERQNSLDLDGTPFRIISQTTNSGPDRLVSDELQLLFSLGDLNLVTGGYYEDGKNGARTTDAGVTVGPFAGSVIFPNTQGSSSSKAVFGQADWKFAPGWALAVGARYTKDNKKSSQQTDFVVPLGAPPITTAPRTNYSVTYDAITWNVALNYQVADDVMVYATARKGYKSGGLNTISDPRFVEYKPEYVTDMEVGIKSQWRVGDTRVRLNVDAFYDSYKDIQRSVTPPTNGVPVLAVQNAAKAKISGLDIDLKIAPGRWFDVTAQYTFIHTNYGQYFDTVFGDLSNGRFPNTPKHQINIVPSLRAPVPDDWGTVKFQAPFFYQSGTAIVVNNRLNGNVLNDLTVPGSNYPGYYRLDFRVDWNKIMGSNFGAAFYLRNVTNKAARVGGLNNLTSQLIGVATTFYAPPRMFNFELRYDF